MNVRNRESSCIPAPSDDLSIKRAAALAWNQRSSSRERLPDKHPTAALHHRRPSCYHLEALRPVAADSSKKPESHSSLLDFYEIELITRELERFIIRAAAEKNDEAGGCRRKVVGKAAEDFRGLRGFFARKAVAFCGSDGTVVPEKRLAVRRSGGRIACRGCEL
ncbi:hypothetical protein KFK09_027211 [Dendrobium nobile]|uniref:Uncharacterized protein n=1 Tax=Dendrobium nobile TaxID=94219 RepID=A0A8T3AF87_DENNO|nr:hypothetical protein KFK09_027211 [Dendrobium nobile]